MYRIYIQDKNQPKAEEAKSFLLKNYPESDYTKIISDPDLIQSLNAKKGEVESFYIATYDFYTQKNYNEALTRCNDALRKFGKNDFVAKFAYLRALCIGNTQPIDSLAKALRIVVVKYPKDEVTPNAKAMLEIVEKRINPQAANAKNDSLLLAQKELYQLNEDTTHYWVIIVPNGKGNVNAFETKLSNFHNTYYSTMGLTSSTLSIDYKSWIIVKSHKNKLDAMTYHQLINGKNEVFTDIKKEFCTLFAISADNMTKLLKKKNFQEYADYFTKNYLGIKQ
jgi:hypothetical protein